MHKCHGVIMLDFYLGLPWNQTSECLCSRDQKDSLLENIREVCRTILFVHLTELIFLLVVSIGSRLRLLHNIE